MNYLKADVDALKSHIQGLMATYPELAEDEKLRADMFEGETDIERIVMRCLDEHLEASSMVDAIKVRETDLRERRSRYERKADAMKSLIKSVMDSADLDKMTLAEATLSITKPRESVEVLNVEELPQGYFKTTKSADKTAIKKAIMESGEEIPGAQLVLGESGLTIRTK